MNMVPAEAISVPVTLSSQLVADLEQPSQTLRATTVRNGSAVVIRVGGEIDAANERTWARLVNEAAAVAARPGPVIVDVSGLDFMGCCAFTVLADEAERCRHRGIAIRIVSNDAAVSRIVAACAFTTVLPVHPTTESALAAA